jgi:hypothetical protein
MRGRMIPTRGRGFVPSLVDEREFSTKATADLVRSAQSFDSRAQQRALELYATTDVVPTLIRESFLWLGEAHEMTAQPLEVEKLAAKPVGLAAVAAAIGRRPSGATATLPVMTNETIPGPFREAARLADEDAAPTCDTDEVYEETRVEQSDDYEPPSGPLIPADIDLSDETHRAPKPAVKAAVSRRQSRVSDAMLAIMTDLVTTAELTEKAVALRGRRHRILSQTWEATERRGLITRDPHRANLFGAELTDKGRSCLADAGLITPLTQD